MLFADRLEIWNPGSLPPSLTLAMLRKPHGSFPRNPLLAEPLYLAKYIERMGTGTGDMIARCKKAGLSAPRFTVTDGFKVKIPRPPGAQRMASGAGGILAATPQGPRKDPARTPQGPRRYPAGCRGPLGSNQSTVSGAIAGCRGAC